MARRLDWPDCRNTRDLGGLPARHGLTRTGVAVRSDNVASLTPAGRQAMIDYGITTIIDLRSESEVKGAPGPPFSEFQSSSPLSPLDGTDGGGPIFLHLALIDDATAPILNQAPTMPERYALMLDRSQEALGEIFDGMLSARACGGAGANTSASSVSATSARLSVTPSSSLAWRPPQRDAED